MSSLHDLRIASLERQVAELKHSDRLTTVVRNVSRGPSAFVADVVPTERLALEAESHRLTLRRAHDAEKRVAELERELKAAEEAPTAALKAKAAAADELAHHAEKAALLLASLSALQEPAAQATRLAEAVETFRRYAAEAESARACRAVNYQASGLRCDKPVGHPGMHRDTNPIGRPGRVAYYRANDATPVFRHP